MADQDWKAFESALADAGFHRLEVEGCPPQVRWWFRPLSWRERMPMVRGFNRSVVVVDVPVQRAERVDGLFEEIASLAASGMPAEEGKSLTGSMPWYFYPLYALTFVVALAAAQFIGISLQLEDHAWCMVVLEDEALSDEAREAVHASAGVAEQFVAVVANYRASEGKLGFPDRPRSIWGRFGDVAKAAVRDMRRVMHLNGAVQVTRRRTGSD